MTLFKGWNWQEDGRKFITAFITSVLGLLALTPQTAWTHDFLVAAVISSLRLAVAGFETSSVPADQVAKVVPLADKDNVQKVIDAKVKTAQAQDMPLKFITPEDVKEKL